MSEMRKDIFSDEWVVFASNRKDKPYNYKHNKNKIRSKNHIQNLWKETIYEETQHDQRTFITHRAKVHCLPFLL